MFERDIAEVNEYNIAALLFNTEIIFQCKLFCAHATTSIQNIIKVSCRNVTKHFIFTFYGAGSLKMNEMKWYVR